MTEPGADSGFRIVTNGEVNVIPIARVDDADLIVTAVNEHDALVARVVAHESVLAEVRRLRDEWRNERPETWAEIHTGLVGLAEASRDAIVADLNAILDKDEVPEGKD